MGVPLAPIEFPASGGIALVVSVPLFIFNTPFISRNLITSSDGPAGSGRP